MFLSLLVHRSKHQNNLRSTQGGNQKGTKIIRFTCCCCCCCTLCGFRYCVKITWVSLWITSVTLLTDCEIVMVWHATYVFFGGTICNKISTNEYFMPFNNESTYIFVLIRIEYCSSFVNLEKKTKQNLFGKLRIHFCWCCCYCNRISSSIYWNLAQYFVHMKVNMLQHI